MPIIMMSTSLYQNVMLWVWFYLSLFLSFPEVRNPSHTSREQLSHLQPAEVAEMRQWSREGSGQWSSTHTAVRAILLGSECQLCPSLTCATLGKLLNLPVLQFPHL